jgi:hypothetical protein
MSLAQAIDALLAYVADHGSKPDYGDRLPEFYALDTAVYIEARSLGIHDADMPRKDATFRSDEVVFFGRTNVPGCWSSPPNAPSTLTLMPTQGWKADTLALRALAEQFAATSGAREAGEDDLLPPSWDRQCWEELQERPRRLLRHMLGRECDTIANVMEMVWGTDRTSDGALSTATHRANAFLLTQGDRRTLSRIGGELRWK